MNKIHKCERGHKRVLDSLKIKLYRKIVSLGVLVSSESPEKDNP